VNVTFQLEPSPLCFGRFLQKLDRVPVRHQDALLLQVSLDLDQVVLGVGLTKKYLNLMRSDKLNISGDYLDNFTSIDFENITVLTTLCSFEVNAEFFLNTIQTK
jgi:hypothetical protein